MKIGAVDPEIIGLKGIIKRNKIIKRKKLTQEKHIAAWYSMPGGINK